jgi:hypothetical protein
MVITGLVAFIWVYFGGLYLVRDPGEWRIANQQLGYPLYIIPLIGVTHIRLLKTQQMKGLPFEPEPPTNENKFVYASAEIAAETVRRARLEGSLVAEKAGFSLDAYLSLAPALLSPVGFPSFATAISEREAV